MTAEEQAKKLKQTLATIVSMRTERERMLKLGRKPEADWYGIWIVQLEAFLPALRAGATEFIVKREMLEDHDQVRKGLAIRADRERIKQNLPKIMQTFEFSAEEIKSAMDSANKSSRGRPRDVESLEALEMKLAGKTRLQIAEKQAGKTLEKVSHRADDNSPRDQGKGRIKQRLKRLRPMYDDVVKKYSES